MKRLILIAFGIALVLNTPLSAQQAGENISVLPVILESEDDLWYLKGDGYLQRQVEPTIAASTRNPDHLISFFVDYRAVDVHDDVGLGEQTQEIALALKALDFALAGLIPIPDLQMVQLPPVAAAEAWVGGSRSYDGGITWSGFFMPGAPTSFYPDGLEPPFDTTQEPIFGLEAATDPVAVAGPCGYVYVVFMAFTRGDESKLVVARFQDLNDSEIDDTWVYQGMTVVESGNNAEYGYFLDKPHINLDVFRDPADFSTYGSFFEAEECGHRVYATYSTFNGLTKDGKFQSKLNFAMSTNGGETFQIQKINKNFGQNQGSFIAIDPRPGTPSRTGGPGTVYVFWRHFFEPDTIIMTRTTDYGVKWSDPTSILGSTAMAPFDQPTISSDSANPISGYPVNPISDLTFRSNGFPTAVVAPFVEDEVDPEDPEDDVWGAALHVAWQERVNIDPLSGLDPDTGLALLGRPDPYGSPRIVSVHSTDGGSTWFDIEGNEGTRLGVDFGDRDGVGTPVPLPGFGALPSPRASGPQVMPWLSFGGGRLALAYYESRGLYGTELHDTGELDEDGDPILESVEVIQPLDISPTTGFISGIERVVDFRVALLDPETGYPDGTTQVSRYPIGIFADLSDDEQVSDIAPVTPEPCSPDFGDDPGLPPCSRSLNFMNKPQSGSGKSAFMGDYPGMTPIVQFINDYNDDTEQYEWRWAIRPTDVPYRAFHAVFADNRHLIPPTTPSTSPEWERYQIYGPPQSGGACFNAGSRNTDVLTSKVDAELVVSAPTTYRLLNTRRGFPISVSNRSDETRFYRLTIAEESRPFATFSVNEDSDLGPTDVDWGDVEIFPYSSVSQVLYVEALPGTAPQIRVDIIQIDSFGGNVIDGGEQGSVTLNPDPNNQGAGGAEEQNPSVVNEGVTNPFVVNPFVVNPFVVNPFVVNPFVVNPFVVNTSLDEGTPVYKVIDNTWSIQADAASTASSYLPVINIDNAEQFVGNYAFQLLVYKASSHGSFDGCQAYNIDQTQVLSNVSQHPDDTTYDPFVVNPFVVNPFVVNPFVVNPFVVNSTFSMAPSDVTAPTFKALEFADDGTLRAPRAPEKIYVTLRAFQLVPNEELGDFEYQPDVDEPAFTGVALPCIDDPEDETDCIVSLAPDLRLGLTEAEPDTFVPSIDGVPVPPETIIAGVPYEVDWTLENIGIVSADAENRDLRHGFYISNNETVALGLDDQPTDGDILVGWVQSGDNTLDPAEIESFSGVTLTVPRNADPDYFKFLVLFVDDYREISEVNERNNQYAMPIIIEPPAEDEFFDGFFSPWTEIPQYTVNAGSAIPLKWRYRDPETFMVVDSGGFAPTILAKKLDTCQPLDPDGPGEITVITENPDDPGSSDLRYSPSSGTWQFNWETDPTKPGCYYLRVINEFTGVSEPLLIILE